MSYFSLAFLFLVYLGLSHSRRLPRSQKIEERIIGGSEVAKNSIPYQVSIKTLGNFPLCSGIIFDETTVITSARCCLDMSPSATKVVSGEHNLYVEENVEQERGISRIIMHEEYDYSKNLNDICILKLNQPLVFESSGVVGRVKMPEMTDAFPAGTVARVSGWGEKGDGLGSDVLMAADLKIDPDQTCKDAYGSFFYPEKNICASLPGKDACLGDTGGPLTCGIEAKLCGIVSWGLGCATEGYPGVYTRLTSYLLWISEHV